MNMKVLSFVVLLFAFSSSYAQPVIHFEQRLHDFGTIKEVNGTVSYNFVFVNRGTSPILVKNVESSCGCTSPEWTKQPILPGQTGFVKATFDPKDRPGYFDKTITVFSNAKTPIVELKIKGTVEGRTRTVLDEYPYELASGLRLPLDHISLMKVRKGDSKGMNYGVYNNSGKKVTVSFTDVPSWLKIGIEPQQMETGKIAMIKASCNTALLNDYGLNEQEIGLLVNGKKYPLKVSVYVEEDFSGKDMSAAPAVNVEKKYYNFGTIASPAQAVYTYKITNTGKSLLKIHRVYANDSRIKVTVAVQELKPGESTEVKAETVEKAMTGKLSGVINVITNSPLTPDLTLRFYGEIK